MIGDRWFLLVSGSRDRMIWNYFVTWFPWIEKRVGI